MNFIRKVSEFLDKICIWMLIVISVVMTACLALLIFGRNIFGQSFAAVEEISRYSLVWLTFIGASVAYRRQEHMGFDYIIVNFLKKKVQRVVLVIKEVMVFLIILCMIYYGKDLVTLNFHERSLQAFIPMGYVYIVIPFSAVVMLFHCITHIYSQARGISELDSNEEKVIIGG